ALGVIMCILSPICLILLGTCAEGNLIPLSEDAAGGIGIMILLAIVAVACGIFLSCSAKIKPYTFLEKEFFESEYGVTGMVEEKKKGYQSVYNLYNITGTVICFIGAIVLFAAAFFGENDLPAAICFCLMLVIVSIGVRFFVIAGMIQGSFERLLQEEKYSIAAKEKAKMSIKPAISAVYWLVVTAIFLAFTLGAKTEMIPEEMMEIRIIWPVAGVLFPIVLIIVNLLENKGK
ncbi:MAG: XRE family transcriptional regulator, partial [Lachnospiraceae bacterium]|nr:XRE family transcriptional regulator [Lachnospiraceae bacterium]